MTLLLGFAIGLLAAAVIVGYRHHRHTALTQYEDQIPTWVNQGNRAVIGTYDEILEAIQDSVDLCLWELEMGDR